MFPDYRIPRLHVYWWKWIKHKQADFHHRFILKETFPLMWKWYIVPAGKRLVCVIMSALLQGPPMPRLMLYLGNERSFTAGGVHTQQRLSLWLQTDLLSIVRTKNITGAKPCLRVCVLCQTVFYLDLWPNKWSCCVSVFPLVSSLVTCLCLRLSLPPQTKALYCIRSFLFPVSVCLSTPLSPDSCQIKITSWKIQST